MRTQGMTGKRALLASGIAILGLSLCSCSSAGNIIGFFRFWDSNKPKVGFSNQDVERIGFQVRPVRGNAEAHYNLGCYYQERDRHREAIEEFQKAVTIDATNVKALNRLGISYDEVREFPRAVAAYKAAIEAHPNVDYTYNNLAHSYRLQGRFEESIVTFKKALAINNTSPRIHDNLGLVYIMIGQHENAQKEFEQAIALAHPGRTVEQAADKKQQPKVVEVKKPVEAERTVEAEKPPVETVKAVQTEVTKRVEIKKTTKVTEAEKPVKVKAAKTAAIKKAVVVKKIVAKAPPVRNVGTMAAKPISLVLQKRRVIAANSGVQSAYNRDGFYAELAKSIVQVRPVVLTPIRGWASYPTVKIWL